MSLVDRTFQKIGKQRVIVERKAPTRAQRQVLQAQEDSLRGAVTGIFTNADTRGRGRFAVGDKSRRIEDGITFDSLNEVSRYRELKLLQQAGAISDLTLQPSFEVKITGAHFCTFTADFSYLEYGQRIVEDVKSTGTAKDTAYRLRKKAAELFHKITVKELIR
jgi:hypothetical protein